MSVNALFDASVAPRQQAKAEPRTVYTEADFALDVTKTLAFGAIALPAAIIVASQALASTSAPLLLATILTGCGLIIPALAYAVSRSLRRPGSAPGVAWTLTKYIGPILLVGVIWAVKLVSH